MKNYFEDIKNDFSSSLVVFLVALPLCLGIALASGVSPVQGLLAGIIGGVVIGPLAGAPLQVSGPAAGLVVVVFTIVKEDGVGGLALATLIGGLIQITGGFLKKGELFKLIPLSVISGMLMGIGTLILFSQFHMLFDQNPASSFFGNLKILPKTFSAIIQNPQLLILPTLGLLVLLGWEFLKEKRKISIPSQLVAVVSISVIGFFIPFEIKMVQISENILAKIGDGIIINNFPGFSINVLIDGIVLGLIASAESMLSTGAVSNLKPEAEVHYSKELFAQGVGNCVAGFLGAIPVTGVIVRTSANIEAGARSRWSAILHGIWLLLFVAIGSNLLRHIPLSVLAVILVIIGLKLMNPKKLWTSLTVLNYDNLILIGTWLGIIFLDLLSGVCVGIGLAALNTKPVKDCLLGRTNLF